MPVLNEVSELIVVVAVSEQARGELDKLAGNHLVLVLKNNKSLVALLRDR